jgi:diacylglycerol O-acyltransferase / wax synthase
MSTTTTPIPPQLVTEPIDRATEIPLVDWGSLALRAGRVAPVLPHMAWLLRFSERVSEQALSAEARRFAATPYGLGRRIMPPRLPGGRHRWRQERVPPAVTVARRPLAGSDALAAWLDRELGVPLDPEHGAGWRIAAAPTADDGTAVLIIVHHLFGTGGGILGALYGDEDVDPTTGTTETRFEAATDFTVWREARGIAERVSLGLRGAARLAGAIPAAVQRRDGQGSPELTSPPPVRPPRGRDRTRRPPSNLRVAAIASLPAADWDGTAAARGGTGNTLLAAVAANLLRRARIARGGRAERTLRLLLPVDLTDRDVARVLERSSGPAATMTTAEVVLEGGTPAHGELATLRARMKAAFIADSGRVPAVRGAGDVMRLLPERLTFRAAARAALRFDGCASNVGAVPPRMLELGPHVAEDVAMLGFPIGNESITVLIRYRDQVAVTVVTDPLRLGPAADLRTWLLEELAGWGLGEVVWR